MRTHDRIDDAPTPLTLGRLREGELPPEPVLVSFMDLAPVASRQHLRFPMRDSMNPEHLPTEEALRAFLAAAHPAVSARPSYWHCRAGHNCAAFGVAAYLHLYRGMSISGAIERLRGRRDPRVLCNPLLEGTLRGWFGTRAEQGFRPPTVEEMLRRRGQPAIPTVLHEPIPMDEAEGLAPFQVLQFASA